MGPNSTNTYNYEQLGEPGKQLNSWLPSVPGTRMHKLL